MNPNIPPTKSSDSFPAAPKHFQSENPEKKGQAPMHPQSTRLASDFPERHIGPRNSDILEMLKALSLESLDQLSEVTLPESIQLKRGLKLKPGLTEKDLLTQAKAFASKNRVFRSFIGQGYYGTHTPTVVLRNILENPAWYTAYTPYQAEISQGRMEALINFQTMVMDLTGCEMTNASLLDEGTAAAEAVTMALGITRAKAKKLFVDQGCFQQTQAVLKTRMAPLGIEVVVGNATELETTEDFFAVISQQIGASGVIHDTKALSEKCLVAKTLHLVSCDLLASCLVEAPGQLGADIVFGSSQRFGVPFGFGGPHAAFIATKEKYKRQLPGRIIGVSKDQDGRPALRLALQTREQHIRREKATSNICTSQVLLAVMASMYAVYHGPRGLKKIATRTHERAKELEKRLEAAGFQNLNESYFDTLRISVNKDNSHEILERALQKGYQLWQASPTEILISTDELTQREELQDLVECFTGSSKDQVRVSPEKESNFDFSEGRIPAAFLRKSNFLSHPVFNSHHSETELLRYMSRLEKKDLSLNHSMIPLGSCTMKLNATTEMVPVTWPEFSQIHPFSQKDQATGYLALIEDLQKDLCEITGFDRVSLQPNAGSQGEYAGLLAIRSYHESRGETGRTICLIPSSAHGTNPASAVMAGFQVVVVACDDHGNIDWNDLNEKVQKYGESLGALMVTYPSTHGVFEEKIKDICQLIHHQGGQVYLDGANMNALVGLARPGDFGADVCHLNLHKTFCIPHGGGGPGVGPIGVLKHLAPFLPGHPFDSLTGGELGSEKGAVSAAPFGSAGILPISWAYIKMMGPEGLKKSTQVAILSANHIARALKDDFPILYSDKQGRVAHECIIDLRDFKQSAGITVDDIAKRLMDYGFHAPTMSWPVSGTMMIEPTESESKAELDRFIEAMKSIRNEIREIEAGQVDRENNVLKNAPHPAARLIQDNWQAPYSREKAAYPLPWVMERKFWPSVGRVDNAHGDKNLVCSCLGMDAYKEN